MPEQPPNRFIRTLIHASSIAIGILISSFLLNSNGRVAFPDIVALARIWRGGSNSVWIWIALAGPWILALTVALILATDLKLLLPHSKPYIRVTLSMIICVALFVLAANLLHGFPLAHDPALTFHASWGLIGEAALFMGGFVVVSELVRNRLIGIVVAVLGIVAGYIFYYSAGNFDPDPGLFFSGTQEIQQIAASAIPLMIVIACILAASTLLSKAVLSYVFDA